MKEFYKAERARHQELIKGGFFGMDKGNGFFKGKKYPFIMKDGLNNLYEHIRKVVIQYFKDNGICWWAGSKSTGHVLSSQIACLILAFPLDNLTAIIPMNYHSEESHRYSLLLYPPHCGISV